MVVNVKGKCNRVKCNNFCLNRRFIGHLIMKKGKEIPRVTIKKNMRHCEGPLHRI